MSRLSVEISCLTVPKKFVGEPFGVSENLWCRKKFLHKRGHHELPWKTFSLTVLKNFVDQHFCVSENSGCRKILWIRRADVVDVTIRNRKNIWHDRDSNPGPTASEPCYPNPTAVIHC